jgi:hypothetical protein
MKRGAASLLLLLRFAALLGIIVPLFAANPNPMSGEWVAIFFTALVAYLGTYVGDYYSFLHAGMVTAAIAPVAPVSPIANPNDVALFKELIDLLKPELVFSMFGQFDFGGAFRYEDVRPVTRFSETWCNADKEFIDQVLEDARKDALAKARKVSSDIARYTRPLNGGLQTVKLGNVDRQPDSVRDQAKLINDAAGEFAKSYETLIRLGRLRLIVV